MTTKISKILTICLVSVIIISALVIPSSAYVTSTTNSNTRYYPIAFNRISFYGQKQNEGTWITDWNSHIDVALPQTYSKQDTNETIIQNTKIDNDKLDQTENNHFAQQQYISSSNQQRTYLFGDLYPRQRRLSCIEFYAPFGVLDNQALTDFTTFYLRLSGGTFASATLQYSTMIENISYNNDKTKADISFYHETHEETLNIRATDNDYSNISINVNWSNIYNTYKELYYDENLPKAKIYNIRILLYINSDINEPIKHFYFNYSAWQTQYFEGILASSPIATINTNIITEVVELSDFNLLNFVTNAVNSFLEIEIFPNFTFGWILWIVIGISVLFIFLKVFLGG